MTHFEVREKFFQFFTSKNHKVLESSSLIPQNDPSLLFVNAGMNQFKNIFLGVETPKSPQVVTIQKCLRAGGKHNDIENVGETARHHTFFEMMGNFSFGSYFKKRAMELAWEFLTKEMHFSEDHLWVSVYKDDEESFEIWKNHLSIPEHKILRLGAKDNFWQMGEVGPCGPCSEIHYYNGNKKNPHPDELFEVWNLVFMEFYDTEKGKREKLPQPCVDTGLGLERLSSLVQKTTSNYSTDLFKNIISSIEKHSPSHQYNFKEHLHNEEQKAFRVIADHSRSIAFLINEGIIPGSEGASYVLRRIMRRSLYYNQKLNNKVNLVQKATQSMIDTMSPIYPHLKKDQELISSLIEEEEERFKKSLETGRKKLEEKIQKKQDSFIDFEIAWDLYSTYGFPVDLTRIIAQEKNYKMIDESIFEKEKSLLEKNQKTNFHHQKNHIEDLIKNLKEEHFKKETLFTGYKKESEKTSLLFLFEDEKPFSSLPVLKEGQSGWVVTEKTCFYPEGGGPIGDRGQIETQTGTAQVTDCLKRNKVIFHKVEVLKGQIEMKQTCQLSVDSKFRSLISTSHSATHLLNAALRNTLGNKIRQAGSLVEPGYLRFDFTHPQPLTQKELESIEEQIIQVIKNNESVSETTLPYDQAINEGSLSLGGENYDKEVRVITVGQDTSKELCGGIHVKETKDLQDFKILSETGVQSGVRRITALTSTVAEVWESDLKQQSLEICQHLKIPLENLEKKENPFLKWEQEQDLKLEQIKNKIVNLNPEKESSTKKTKAVLSNNFFSNRLNPVKYNLELRQHLNLSTPKWIEKQNPFLPWVEKKKQQLETLEKQLQKLKSISSEINHLLDQSKPFKTKDTKGNLLVAHLPLEDRVLLAETADQLKSKISSGIIVVIGEGEDTLPLIVTVTKNLQEIHPAGVLLKKTIAPFLQGKGGGQKHFAQGAISDKSKLPELEEHLLKEIEN